ncbi:sporulation integral membrane protein YtvI [Paenibacillus validus]|uniref:Sporulation integral membrane protein YtvI n=1 Tax=Paenibacillus validus TaxID=44253 RepID=A0A7X2ZE43_9BACL|nr:MULTISPECIES: sporulation integral membrane protein YtvI [Paenibacillus]MED4601848.1 sporulation integral membrane protein YtvI [Paenibacillus validus]MED4605917.1 sporulation integral membrane protein YtvI [Paenibacillus validus]MUG73245.1 sporulation integral membrane protein YtvI [Paenibacillus validus]
MSLRTILFCALGALVLYGLFTVGFPFLLALLLAILLEPVVQALIKYARFNRIAAAVTACTLFTGLLLGFIYLVGFKMVSELVQYLKNAPSYLNEAKLFMENTSVKTQFFFETLPPAMAADVQHWIENGLVALTENLNSIVSAVSGYLIGIARTIPNLFIFFVVFVIALYLVSLSLPKLHQSFLNLFESGSRSKVVTVLTDLRRAIVGFLFAQMLISLLTYIVSLIGLLVLRVDYPLAIALLIIVVDVLPVLGVSAVLLPWAVYSLLVGNMQLAIGLIVLYLVIVVFRRLIEPKIIGDAVGINALAALVSMYVGFQAIGVVGLFLGPVLIIVYQALRRVGILKINIKLEG